MYRSQPFCLTKASQRSIPMSWSKPAYIDLRIGFEVTMYFASR
ncbi:Coenzyme PQQ synthesis protein A [Pseudomonas brassicacearum]|nr:Coenzyme PQQ synthesis protein A [Pseudomonas brassicacearum]